MMDLLYKLLHETSKFGLSELAFHALYRMGQKDRDKCKMMQLREKYYSGLNDQQFANELKENYESVMQCPLHLDTPRTFTEKIQWLKFYDSTPEKTKLADKYLVREWIAEKMGEEYLVPLLGVWDDFDGIDFETLPDQFCLKTNHGCGMNLVVKDKSTMDAAEAKELFSSWMQTPFWAISLEKQYKNIPRKIIAEKYIEEINGGLYDYKIHCFNGQPEFIQCIGDRDLKAHTGSQCNYDINWNKLDWIFEDYPLFPYEVPKPALLLEMTECAKKLSKGFAYVRVDLYEIGKRIYFGEMTFTPASGKYRYRGTWTRERDMQLGDLLQLPH